MNNVDKAMELAGEYSSSCVELATISRKDTYERCENLHQALRTHLEAMEADRARLLESLKAVEMAMSNKQFSVEVLSDDSVVRQMIRAAINQSKEQS